MKMFVTGWKRVKGHQKDTPADTFDFAMLRCLVPSDVGGSDRVQVTGGGSEQAEIEMTAEGVKAASAIQWPPHGQFMDVLTDQAFKRGKFATVCVGLMPISAPSGK